MHPVMRQQLAAERVSEMIAEAQQRHLARRARLARRSRSSGQVTRPAPPRTPDDTERPAARTAAASAGPAR